MESAQFQDIAAIEKWYWWFQVRYRHVADILVKRDVAADARVVDWGCGTGGFIEYLTAMRSFPRDGVVGFEPSDYARKILNARGIPYTVPDLTRPFLDQIEKPVNAVTMLDVLEHVEKPAETLAYLRDGVAPGGCLVVLAPAFPHLWSEWDERLGHWRRYTIASLEREIKFGGWQVVTARYLFSAMYPVGFLRKHMIRTKKISEVEFPKVSERMNKFLTSFFSLEARMSMLPFGTSVSVVAIKK
ncbi:MAG: methyltransferase domain-containing protein [Smithella sp.]